MLTLFAIVLIQTKLLGDKTLADWLWTAKSANVFYRQSFVLYGMKYEKLRRVSFNITDLCTCLQLLYHDVWRPVVGEAYNYVMNLVVVGYVPPLQQEAPF